MSGGGSAPRDKSGRRASALWIGLCISLPLHAVLIGILARIPAESAGGADGAAEVVTVETPPAAEPSPPAPLQPPSAPAREPEPIAPEVFSSTVAPGAFEMPAPPETTSRESPSGAADLYVSTAGRPGGTGTGSGSGTGPVAGTTFFGARGRGRRIGYVVDKSGSMGQGTRLLRAVEELDRSVGALPDFASVCVAFYDGNAVVQDPAGQFVRCRRSDLDRLRAWFRTLVSGGTTNPAAAFQFVLSRASRPDLIFFLTDGEIPDTAAETILQMNRRGAGAVIHCIAFGNEAATAPLRRIAAETRGTFSIERTGAP